MNTSTKKITLFTSFFVPVDEHRKKEIEVCMKNNIRNREIDAIVNIGHHYDHPKVTNLQNIGKPKFSDFLQEFENFDSEYYIIANADIFFCTKIKRIFEIDFENRFLCLTRWNVLPSGEVDFYGYECSQDVWVFKGRPKKFENVDFQIGVPGCDGRFAFELKHQGLQPINPSLSIYSYHLHRQKHRDYDSDKDRLSGERLDVAIEDYENYKLKKNENTDSK
jgi:hypothetical protein